MFFTLSPNSYQIHEKLLFSGDTIYIVQLVSKLDSKNVTRAEFKELQKFTDSSKYVFSAQQRQFFAAKETEKQKLKEVFNTLDWSYNSESKQQVLAFGGKFGRIRILWFPCHGSFKPEKERVYSIPSDDIMDLVFHPHQTNLLLSASNDRLIRLWNINIDSKQSIAHFTAHLEGAPLSLDFDKSGQNFVSSGLDNNIMVWAFNTKELNAAIAEPNPTSKLEIDTPILITRDFHVNYIDSVMFIAKNVFLSKAATEDSIVMWMIGEVNDEQINTEAFPERLARFDLPNSSQWFMKMAIDRRGRHVAVGNDIGQTFVYDLGRADSRENFVRMYQPDRSHNKPSRKKRKNRKTSAKPIAVSRHCAFTRDGKFLVVAYDDGSVEMFDLENDVVENVPAGLSTSEQVASQDKEEGGDVEMLDS